jgi:uncharacterized protein YjbI with pentapeptide repeats
LYVYTMPAVGTELSEADLEGADLSEAIFDPAYRKESKALSLDRRSGETTIVVRHTSLGGASLKGANLYNSWIADEQLAQCKSLDRATMPDGQKYEDWLATPEGQRWLREYQKNLGSDKKGKGVYEDWIKTTEGKM